MNKKTECEWIKNYEVAGIEKAHNINNYENIKENLIIRLMNYERNKIRMENLIYQAVEDMALILHVIIRKEEDEYIAIPVERPMFQRWQIPEAEAFKIAAENTNLLYGVRMCENFLGGRDLWGLKKGDLALKKGYVMNFLTNRAKRYGAAVIFYPGVNEKVAELFQDDFYIVFTSIHEAMLHARTDVDPQRLKKGLAAVNMGSEPAEILTDKVYCYSRREKRFFSVV